MTTVNAQDLGRALMTPEAEQDPWGIYDQMRAESPVYWSAAQNAWIVTGYAEAEAVLAQPAAFSSEGTRGRNVYRLSPEQRAAVGLSDVVSTKPALTHADPPDHTLHRAYASKPLTPRSLAPLREWITIICQESAARLTTLERPDLVDDFALPLSMRAVTKVFGAPDGSEELYLDLARCQRAFFHEFDPPYQAALELEAVLTRFQAHIDELSAQKRSDPDGSLLAAMVDDGVHGRPLNPDEVLGICVQFLGAAFETTIAAIAAAVYGLIRAGQYGQACEQPGGAQVAFSEALRWQAPAHRIPRRTTGEVVLGGQTLAPSSLVFVMLGAANRDPQIFDRPHDFDISRELKPHLAFGHGIHSCAGTGLARLEAVSALSALFELYPDMTLADGYRATWCKFPAARTLSTLEVDLGVR